ncbi:MAG: IS4 family transposase, partial [Planctomycetaceae bacterium]|nr:IS4 family transposase [Planctomycetaceae bacterium]
RKGWLCHNSLAVSFPHREVLGLASQILHRRAAAPAQESMKSRRERTTRESRLWLEGTKALPASRQLVDVCDRGADTFEFLEHEVHSGRTFVIRSAYNRGAVPKHGSTMRRGLLHDLVREAPALGQWTLSVPAARLVKKPRQTGQDKIIHRPKHDAVVQVAALPVEICLPCDKSGDYGTEALQLWIVRVWEGQPPLGAEPMEWLLLTNHPVESFQAAWDVVGWYECRWIIEEYHKAQKTGCGIENPQFTTSGRLHAMIALLSVVALSLLNLRELSRRAEAKTRLATDIIAEDYVCLLSLWRRGRAIPQWSIHDFCMALARLGGHLNRKHVHDPGWIVLWRGWTQLQLMMEGANAVRKMKKCA